MVHLNVSYEVISLKTDNSKKLKMQKIISALITAIGFALMVYMIAVEDEPGAIPLLLMVGGAAWFFITRARIRSQFK